MPNDINKLRRLMRTAHVLQKGDDDHKFGQSLALKQAWWFESFRDALSNGFARFTYYKKDGSTRTALGTRSPLLIPVDKVPKCPMDNEEWEDRTKAIPYFDLEKNEWRSFSVLNFVKLEQVWRFNSDPLPFPLWKHEEPIPLTPEILEKNGFVYADLPFEDFYEGYGLRIHSGNYADGHSNWYIICGINVSMNVTHVHELQLALRLCGIEKEVVL